MKREMALVAHVHFVTCCHSPAAVRGLEADMMDGEDVEALTERRELIDPALMR
jgi:hypothetical protein